MKAVPSGLEEDCVFNPKNIKVVGIAKAPNAGVLAELQQLLRSPRSGYVGGASHRGSRGYCVSTMQDKNSAGDPTCHSTMLGL